jgi:PhnB protein
MSDRVKPVPPGYHTLTPYMVMPDATAALAFYAVAFGAVEVQRIPGPEGGISHAEMAIGSSRFMLTDENAQAGARCPGSYGGSPVMIYLYVSDVDMLVSRAVAAGARLVHPVQRQFYGDRMGTIRDPFGYTWFIASRVEMVTQDELDRRIGARLGQVSG